MATNEIHIDISDNQVRVPLSVGSRTLLRSVEPDDGSPYYVGARAYVTQTAGGAVVTVIDKDGTTTATIDNGTDGADGVGISDISLTSTSGNVDTYTITYTNGDTDTFTVTNGVDGQDGADGQDGQDGADGFSPTATVSKVGDTATITITDKNGTTTAEVYDGSGGGASAFVAEFNVTTYADVKDAYDNDAIIICTADDSGNTKIFQLAYYDDGNNIFYFAEPSGDGWDWTSVASDDTWDNGTMQFASTDTATQLRDGLMSALDKQKLDGLSKRNIWYGTCSTSASQSPKAITTASGDFSLTAGNMLVVKFSNTNSLSSASLQVDGGTAKSVYQLDGTSNIANRWGGGEVVMFAYDGTKFILLDQSTASTTQYGITKLNNTVTSTSTSEAATANAVKAAYDNGGVQSVNGNTGAVTVTVPTKVSDLSNDSGFTSTSVTRHTTTGTNIADLTIDGVTTKLYAPTGGGGGGITDVEVDGTSVVTGGVAEIDLTGKSDVGHTHTKSAITDFPSLATVATSGSYADLLNKPTIPTVNDATLTIQKNGTTVKTFTANASSNVTANITVPTDTGDLTNGAGFITGYTETDPVFSASAAAGISSSDISNWNGKSDFSGDYDDLSNKPTIPSNTSDLVNDSGFLDKLGILNLFYPVGSYYETSDTSFDPSVSWGGTWVLETEGQVHISGSASGTYQVSGAPTDTSDGGAATHTLTESELPSVSGNFKIRKYANSSGTVASFAYDGTGNIATEDGGSSTTSVKSATQSAGNTLVTFAFGSGNSHNNMQPYIIVNRWHRTA